MDKGSTNTLGQNLIAQNSSQATAYSPLYKGDTAFSGYNLAGFKQYSGQTFESIWTYVALENPNKLLMSLTLKNFTYKRTDTDNHINVYCGVELIAKTQGGASSTLKTWTNSNTNSFSDEDVTLAEGSSWNDGAIDKYFGFGESEIIDISALPEGITNFFLRFTAGSFMEAISLEDLDYTLKLTEV